MNKLEELNKHREFVKAYYFLCDHPALSIPDYKDFSISNNDMYFKFICKNNHVKYNNEIDIEDFYIKIYKEDNEELFEKLKCYDQDYEQEDTYISLPYEKVYNEPWKFDRFEYETEVVIYKVNKEQYNKYKRMRSIVKKFHFVPYIFDCIHVFDVSGKTYEETILNFASKIKQEFGDYSFYDFLTPEEKLNHETELPMIFEDIENDFWKMKRNPKFVEVSNIELANRYWNFFETTENYKKYFNCD